MDAFEKRVAYLTEKYGADIRIMDLPDLEMSSSDIRKRIADGKAVRFMIPDKVMSYIEDQRLYI